MKSIPLTQGKFALVDDEDFEEINKHKWYFQKNGYAVRDPWPRTSRVYMHRSIMNFPSGLEVDHINGDKLDNRKENLRISTHSENGKNQAMPKNNTSGFKGVTRNKRDNNWTAQINANGKHVTIGNFKNAEDAARAYDIAAIKHFGEFARLNFPDV